MDVRKDVSEEPFKLVVLVIIVEADAKTAHCTVRHCMANRIGVGWIPPLHNPYPKDTLRVFILSFVPQYGVHSNLESGYLTDSRDLIG